MFWSQVIFLIKTLFYASTDKNYTSTPKMVTLDIFKQVRDLHIRQNFRNASRLLSAKRELFVL